MPRTFLRQATQVLSSDLYDDTLAAGTTLETAPLTLEDDLSGLRSQAKRAIWADAAGNWYDDIPTINSKKRGIRLLNFDLDDIEEHKFLFRTTVLADVTVPATQNFVVLSVAGSEAPTVVAAVALTQDGAVVAQSALSGAGFEVHELIEIAGPNAIAPYNLVVVRDAVTGQKIQSSGRDVFGLLQYESTGVDGAAFDDTSAGNRVKISFVRMNAGLDDLEAVSVADIENKIVNYKYVYRLKFDSLPQHAMLGDGDFVDHAANVDVTLDRAIDNQGGAVTQTDRNILWRITDTFTFKFQTSDGGVDLFAVIPNVAGDEIELNLTDFDVNTTNPSDFNRGLKVATATTEIDVGVNAGVIETTGTNDLRLLGARELFFDDGNQTGSTWAQTTGIKLSDTTAEWDAFETAFGEVSLLNAIVAASNNANRTKTTAAVTANVAINVDVGGVSGGANLDVQLHNLSTGNFITDHDIYVNGELMRNGADASANHDVYPGTSLANGQLKFEFPLKTIQGSKPADQITVISYA